MSEDQIESSEGWKNLRAELAAMKEAQAAAAAELESYRSKEREATVKEVLKAKGLPEKAASFYSGEASPDAVSKWVDENADVFGIRPPAGDPANDANALAAALAAAASGGASGTDPGTGDSRKVYGDPLERQRLIQTLPYPELVKLGLMPDPAKDPFRRPAV